MNLDERTLKTWSSGAADFIAYQRKYGPDALGLVIYADDRWVREILEVARELAWRTNNLIESSGITVCKFKTGATLQTARVDPVIGLLHIAGRRATWVAVMPEVEEPHIQFAKTLMRPGEALLCLRRIAGGQS